jgi:hypothetical protein
VNRFVSPWGLIRWTGVAVLASMLAVIGYALRTGSADDPVFRESAYETYTMIMGLGLWTAIISLNVVGVALLVARPATPEPERDRVKQVDYWA